MTGQPWIVERTDPLTGEEFLTWAALVPVDQTGSDE